MSHIIGMYRCLKIALLFITAIFIVGCARYSIGYDIKTPETLSASAKTVAIVLFSDERPPEERDGLTDELFSFSSRDSQFDKEVRVAITSLLKEELGSRGVRVFIIKDIEDLAEFDYILKGRIVHFQTVMKPSKSTLVPYLGAVSTIWAEDKFLTVITIDAELLDRNNNQIFKKAFNISGDIKLRTGILSVKRLGRGLNYKLKLLNLGLSDVLAQIREEVLKDIQKDGRIPVKPGMNEENSPKGIPKPTRQVL